MKVEKLKLTIAQAVVLEGFTGVCFGRHSEFHKDVEQRLGRAVHTAEFANPSFWSMCKDLYKNDFIKMEDKR